MGCGCVVFRRVRKGIRNFRAGFFGGSGVVTGGDEAAGESVGGGKENRGESWVAISLSEAGELGGWMRQNSDSGSVNVNSLGFLFFMTGWPTGGEIDQARS